MMVDLSDKDNKENFFNTLRFIVSPLTVKMHFTKPKCNYS